VDGLKVPRARDRPGEDAIITKWTRKHTKEEVMELVSGVGVPAGAVFDPMDLQNDPSFEERGIMPVMDHPNNKFKMPTWPVGVDGQPPKLKPSPRLGELNADVTNVTIRIHLCKRSRDVHLRGREEPGVSAIIRQKHLRLDQRKLDRARRVLGARTDTEPLERALDVILAEERTRRALRSVGGKGRIRRVFP